jgi:CheY-like chemotaxis protein
MLGVRALIVAEDLADAGRAFLSLSGAGAGPRLVRRRDQLATFVDEVAPEVIVLDCDLRGSAALARELRRDRRTAGAVIVGLSGRAGRGPRLRASGVDLVLRKPVDPATFAQRLLDAAPVRRGLL